VAPCHLRRAARGIRRQAAHTSSVADGIYLRGRGRLRPSGSKEPDAVPLSEQGSHEAPPDRRNYNLRARAKLHCTTLSVYSTLACSYEAVKG
jgi:hypothetical protein